MATENDSPTHPPSADGSVLMFGRILIPILFLAFLLGVFGLLFCSRLAGAAEFEIDVAAEPVRAVFQAYASTPIGLPIPGETEPTVLFRPIISPRHKGGTVEVSSDLTYVPPTNVRIRAGSEKDMTLVQLVQPSLAYAVEGRSKKLLLQSEFETIVDGFGVGSYQILVRVPSSRGGYYEAPYEFTFPFNAGSGACKDGAIVKVVYHLGYPWGTELPPDYQVSVDGVDFSAISIPSPPFTRAEIWMDRDTYLLQFAGSHRSVIKVEGVKDGVVFEDLLPSELYPCPPAE